MGCFYWGVDPQPLIDEGKALIATAETEDNEAATAAMESLDARPRTGDPAEKK